MVLLLLGAGFGPLQAAGEKLIISGSTTILPLAQRLASGYQRLQPGLSIRISGGGSIAGLQALIDGNIDIATSSSFVSDPELKQAFERGVYPVPFRIAYDGILPVVHPGNPLRDISREQLRRIYRGQIDNWRQLGGPDLTIRVIARDAESGTQNVWQEMVMNQLPIADSAERRSSSAAVVGAVADNPGAIGFIGLSYLNARVKPLSVETVMGSSGSIRNGSYAISRPLFMFTDGWPAGATLEFINYVLDTSAGQRIIEDTRYVPLH